MYYIFQQGKVWVSTDYSSIPIRVSLNGFFESKDFPSVKFKLLKIDKENNKCLLENTSKSDVNFVSPQWFSKNDPIFPSLYGTGGVILEEITDDNIYVTVHWGRTEFKKKSY